MKMNHIDIKKDVLLTFFPEESYVVEPDAFELIVSRDVELTRSSYGSNTDLFEVFTILVSAASLADNVINVVTALRKKENKQDIPVEDVVKELPTTYSQTLGEEKTVRIIYHVVEKLDDGKG